LPLKAIQSPFFFYVPPPPKLDRPSLDSIREWNLSPFPFDWKATSVAGNNFFRITQAFATQVQTVGPVSFSHVSYCVLSRSRPLPTMRTPSRVDVFRMLLGWVGNFLLTLNVRLFFTAPPVVTLCKNIPAFGIWSDVWRNSHSFSIIFLLSSITHQREFFPSKFSSPQGFTFRGSSRHVRYTQLTSPLKQPSVSSLVLHFLFFFFSFGLRMVFSELGPPSISDRAGPVPYPFYSPASQSYPPRSAPPSPCPHLFRSS